jgi:hypothetical protein
MFQFTQLSSVQRERVREIVRSHIIYSPVSLLGISDDTVLDDTAMLRFREDKFYWNDALGWRELECEFGLDLGDDIRHQYMNTVAVISSYVAALIANPPADGTRRPPSPSWFEEWRRAFHSKRGFRKLRAG